MKKCTVRAAIVAASVLVMGSALAAGRPSIKVINQTDCWLHEQGASKGVGFTLNSYKKGPKGWDNWSSTDPAYQYSKIGVNLLGRAAVIKGNNVALSSEHASWFNVLDAVDGMSIYRYVSKVKDGSGCDKPSAQCLAAVGPDEPDQCASANSGLLSLHGNYKIIKLNAK